MDIIRVNRTKNNKSKEPDLSESSDFAFGEDSEQNCRAYVFGEEIDLECLEFFQRKNNEENFVSEEDYLENEEYEPADFFRDEIALDDEKRDQSGGKKRKKRTVLLKTFLGLRRLARVAAVLVLVVIISGGLLVNKGADVKSRVLGISDEAFDNVDMAINSMKTSNFAVSSDRFGKAYNNFSSMSSSLEDMGLSVISISRFVPGASQLSSGYELVQTGKHLSSAGKKISEVAKNLEDLKKTSFNLSDGETVSALSVFRSFEKDIEGIEDDLLLAQKSLARVKTKDIPKEKRESVTELRVRLPIIIQGIEEFSNNSHIIADLLGANGPRKYLFLFQNNQEIRATGGFIGSYGLLDISGDGRIRNFFIDGIFNPDGQLADKIVPPKPIQKVSAAWSLHDSNWFADFPLSAKKAISFYEKTGGPTVDGVITLTPTVMQKLLEITGPIYMEDYDIELDSENFIHSVQYKVEEDYDKEENRPKKILADLAPLVLDRLLTSNDAEIIAETANVLKEALREKHILIYSSNAELENIISDIGWSGEVLDTSNDYLSVINSNINGYKTDGVIEENIKHETEINQSGDIVDTVTITRKHNGGNEEYEWWNKVNANYMRVYVPKGSELIDAEGHTWEFNESSLDYNALNFERDDDVEKEEKNMEIDSTTGTRIYNESGKTVFANWVYVSPQEEVVVKYKYKLPFKMSFNSKEQFNSFSLLAQKQSGSIGSKFDYSIKYPKEWSIEWSTENVNRGGTDELSFSGSLKKDQFIGAIFSE